ncbi:MAG TPA: hypothetical protein VHH36_05340, partial [Candidatus Thermoplasmatota archaeon]|nr:hypothetical protein [Candidatus Thermoplasmatota archaeon]
MPSGYAAGRPSRRAQARALGEDAHDFARWFVKSRFALMESMLGELERDPRELDFAALRARFLCCTRHGKRVLAARAVVTALLALGVAATAAAAVS